MERFSCFTQWILRLRSGSQHRHSLHSLSAKRQRRKRSVVASLLSLPAGITLNPS